MGWIAAVGERGETILPPDIPSSGLQYGPDGTGTLAQRVQAVKDGTSPGAVVHPGGSPTVVNPGDSIATKITTAGTNGTLWFTKGNHFLSSSVAPLAGQTWVLESISGFLRDSGNSAILDGQNGALNFLVSSSALNVTIRGGVFQSQGDISSGSFAAAILAGGGPTAGGWLIEDAIVQNNFNIGVKFQAPNCIARRVYMTNNGRYGPSCSENTPSAGERFAGIRFENCRWSNNNSRQLNPGDAAGGSKFLHCPGLVVEECWVHDNWGFGIWADVPNIAGDIVFQNNVAEANRWGGLFLEGPMGGSKIIKNRALNNGYFTGTIGGGGSTKEANAQIRITHSDSSLDSGIRGEVSRNDVDFTLTQSGANGPALILWNHNPPHPGRMRNWDIKENRFWFRTANTQRILALDQSPDGIQLWDGDNDFIDNEYNVSSPSANYWTWDSGAGTGVAKNYSQWQAFHPGDNIPLVTI